MPGPQRRGATAGGGSEGGRRDGRHRGYRPHWRIACGETGDQMLGRPIEVIMQASGPSVLNWNGEVQGIQPHQLFRNHRETPWATERLYGVIRNWR